MISKKSNLKEMSLIDHLTELRKRLIWSFVYLIIDFAICFYFAESLFAFLANPLVQLLDTEKGQTFIYNGSLVNKGKYKADFVRIIIEIRDENTELIASDSAFVDGSSIKYTNGVITDCALQPGDVGSFSVVVNVPKGAKYEYETTKIHWENVR